MMPRILGLSAITVMFLAGAVQSALAQAPQSPAASSTLGASAVASSDTTPVAASSSYSATSLYNLGNSYARAGKPGLAVLNYERASLLEPNDPDIEANLRYVRQGAHLAEEPRSNWQRAVTVGSPTLWSFFGVLGVLLLGCALLAGERYPAHRWKRRIAVLVGFLLLGATAGNALVLWPSLHAAVIVTAATPVQVSPVPMGDQLFTLPEGETVTITAEHEDFVLVQTGRGRKGWVARVNLVPVVPRRP